MLNFGAVNPDCFLQCHWTKDQNDEWCAIAQWHPSAVFPAAMFNRWIFVFSMNESTKTAKRLLLKMHVDRLRSSCSAIKMCFLKCMFKYSICVYIHISLTNYCLTMAIWHLQLNHWLVVWLLWIPSSCWQPISTMLQGFLMFSLGSSLFPSQYT